MSESKIQSKIIKYLEKKGWLVLKTIRLSKNGYPDLFCFKDGKTMFVEVKSEKGKLSEIQKIRVNELESLGFIVYVCKDITELL